MTSIHFKIYELVAVLSCTFVLIAHSKPTASFNPSQWELSWSDEFDYTGKPNPEIWDYEHGYLGFNEELQNYTDHPDNVRVVDGILIIEAHLKDVSAQRSRAIVKELKGSNAKTDLLGTQEFTSARLITRGKKEFVHSRVEARARFTTGRGTWPAIWLLGDESKNPWPLCGEMDIMEHVGFKPNHVFSAVHSKVSNFMNGSGVSSEVILEDVWNDFHVYAVEWDANSIRYFVDDVCYHVIKKGKRPADDWPFVQDNPFYLILNIAVGGSWGGKEGIDKSLFPQRMEVDYVRVFERK